MVLGSKCSEAMSFFYIATGAPKIQPKANREGPPLGPMRCDPFACACDGVGSNWNYIRVLSRVGQTFCVLVDVQGSAVICHALATNGCAGVRIYGGLLVISTGRFMCVASPNTCTNELVKFKDNRRAAKILQSLRESLWTRVRRWVDTRATTASLQDREKNQGTYKVQVEIASYRQLHTIQHHEAM